MLPERPVRPDQPAIDADPEVPRISVAPKVRFLIKGETQTEPSLQHVMSLLPEGSSIARADKSAAIRVNQTKCKGESDTAHNEEFMPTENVNVSIKDQEARGKPDEADPSSMIGRFRDIAAAGVDVYNNMVLADIQMKVKQVSPKIGVLWFSSDAPDFQQAFDPKSLEISVLMQLPLTDRTLFVVERPAYFLSHHECGSVAAEMESMRFTLCEKLNKLTDELSLSGDLPSAKEETPTVNDGLTIQAEMTGNSKNGMCFAETVTKTTTKQTYAEAVSKTTTKQTFADAFTKTSTKQTSIRVWPQLMDENYFMWPLHDQKFNRMLLTKLALSQGGQSSEDLDVDSWTRIPLDLLKRLARFMGLVSAKRADLLGAVQAHFGTDVAVDFLFTYHYILFSWILAGIALGFHILKNHVEMETYRAYIGPVFQFAVLLPWSIIFTVAWRMQVKSVADTWMADILDNDSRYMNDNLPDFKPWNPSEDSDYYPNWMRAIRTLPLVPLIVVDFLLMMTVLAVVFWAEMYIVFEWGECAQINAQNGNTECQSADQQHGFLGWLSEAIPGLVEGLLFELLLAVSKALARLATWLQNWRTQTEKDLAYMFQLVIFEFIGKFGWIGLLAIVFVPDWVAVEQAKQMMTHRYDQTICSAPNSNNLDSRVFAAFNAMEHSISCLKSRTQYETRLLLFEGAVAAPFWVSQLVSLLIKTFVPSLVVRCRACFRNDHGAQGGCKCKCGRFLLRLLSCMCLLDTGNFGVSDCEYLAGGDTVGKELYESLNNQKEYSEDESHLLKTAWKECIREAYQPLDENIETGMHFFWVIAFGAFYPVGILLGVIVFVFDVRSDFYRLTIVQQRNFRKPPQASLIMLFNFIRGAVACASIFNAFVLFGTYQAMSRWSDKPKYDAHVGLYNYFWELIGMIAGVALVLHIMQVVVLHCTRSYDAAHLETTIAATRRTLRQHDTNRRKSRAFTKLMGLWSADRSESKKQRTLLQTPIKADPIGVGYVTEE